jgi:hypothetical protein
MTQSQNYINHIALVLDASGSMASRQDQLIKVADAFIADLAKESQQKDQETRVTIYSFDEKIKCLIWDKDVLRLPSIKSLYEIGGATALIEATLKSLDDLAHTWEEYGDHSFLVFVITDGEENASGGTWHYNRPALLGPWTDKLSSRLKSLPDHWTVAAMVPDPLAKRNAVNTYGFLPGNVAIWDTSSDKGVEEAISTISAATSSYMTGRTQDVRGTRSVFTMGGNVDASAIKAANLTPLPSGDRKIVRVTKTDDAFEKVVKPVTKSRLKPEMGWFVEIEKFIKRINKGEYDVGKAYYELVKTEQVQGDKEIAVVDVDTNKVYIGDGARGLVGLPEERRTVKPGQNGEYAIYVQSSSLNRHLPVGSHILLLTK